MMASSREKEQTPPHHHQPLLSNLIIRPSHSEAAATGGRSSDYEPGELHRDPPPPYARSDRYPDEPALMLTARSWALRKVNNTDVEGRLTWHMLWYILVTKVLKRSMKSYRDTTHLLR